MNSLLNGTRVHALFGSPVAHSLSPVIFNSVFQKQDFDHVYIPFDITAARLGDAVQAARRFNFEGFNVTIPNKTKVLDYLDRLDATAIEKGSVNTVANTSAELVGYDTDGEGAINALRSYGFNPENKRVLVLGAGGSARAVIHALASTLALIKILNRTPEKAREIADNIKGSSRITFGPITKKNLETSTSGTDLLVNATPLQTTAILSQLNIPLSTMKDVGWLFDLAYDKPAEQVPTIHGRISPLEMLLQQASLSYEIWMGKPAPLDLMRSAMSSHVGGDWR